MWAALFAAIGEGFKMVSSLWGKSPQPQDQPKPIDAAAARSGTAAGAAANHASHIAGEHQWPSEKM